MDTGGIGKATALGLPALGACVLIAGRDSYAAGGSNDVPLVTICACGRQRLDAETTLCHHHGHAGGIAFMRGSHDS